MAYPMPALSMLRPSHFNNTPYRAFPMRETLHLQLRLGISLSKKKKWAVLSVKGYFPRGIVYQGRGRPRMEQKVTFPRAYLVCDGGN